VRNADVCIASGGDCDPCAPALTNTRPSNSSLHSYLILAVTKAARVTMDVGFYYMANAGGRLAGTLRSGLNCQRGGLALMLAVVTAMVAVSAAAAARLRPHDVEGRPD